MMNAMNAILAHADGNVKPQELLTAYVLVYARLKFGHSESMIFNSETILSYPFMRRPLIDYTMGVINLVSMKPAADPLSPEGQEAIQMLIGNYDDFIRWRANNRERELAADSFDDYGLTKEHPVYTCCIGVAESYIAALRPLSGGNAEFRRCAYADVDENHGIVDVYEVTQGGKKIGEIFINAYGNEAPRRAPRGYMLLIESDDGQ